MKYVNNAEGGYKKAFSQSRERLRALKPEEVVGLSLCNYDEQRSCFGFRSFGCDIQISYPDGLIMLVGNDNLLTVDWALILINYLSSAKLVPIANEWVSYRDLPQGNVFYPHIRSHVLEELGRFYSNCDKGILTEALRSLGFVLNKTNADLDAEGSFAPRVPIRMRFWEGEDEIPGSCQVLLDQTTSDQMHIEDIAALCIVIKNLVIAQYELRIKGI